MSTGNPIKWNDQDERRLRAAVVTYNMKIGRLRKANPDNAMIYPPTVKLTEARAFLQTMPRSQLNRYTNSLNRFVRKGAEEIVTSAYGVTTTKWFKKEIGIETAIINRRRTAARKLAEQTEVTELGKPIGYMRSEMGSQRMKQYEPKKFNFNDMTPQNWRAFVESVEKQAAFTYPTDNAAKVKLSYMSVLHNELGAYADDIIKVIANMNDKEFLFKMMKEQEATFETIRSPQQMPVTIAVLRKVWGVDEADMSAFAIDLRELGLIQPENYEVVRRRRGRR